MVVGSVIEDTLVLVLGIGSAASDQVTAFLNGDPAVSVKTNLITWPLKEPSPAGTHGFVAIVPTAALRRGTLKTIMFQHRAKVARYNFASRSASIADFVAMISDLAGPSLPGVIDELVEGLISGPISRKNFRPSPFCCRREPAPTAASNSSAAVMKARFSFRAGHRI